MHKWAVGIALMGMIWAAAAGRLLADGGCCCAHCGCCQPCHKVCRLVCEDKDVEVICWGCKCEEFCVPKHSQRGCKHCEMVCDACGDEGSKDICVEPKRRVWYDWIPGCGANMYTKTKLMRGVTIVTVPSFKWVVEDLCPACTASCDPVPVAPGAEVPPQPLLAANVVVIGAAETPIVE